LVQNRVTIVTREGRPLNQAGTYAFSAALGEGRQIARLAILTIFGPEKGRNYAKTAKIVKVLL